MVDLDGRLINSSYVISAEVESRHYMNGTDHYLVVVLSTGERISKRHGFGFDAFTKLDEIKQACADGR
jgi:hypothetical protein